MAYNQANRRLQVSSLQLSTFHNGMERLKENKMLVYWTYVASASVAIVSMLLAVQACQHHLAYYAMSFSP